jgi:hypothetical protein
MDLKKEFERETGDRTTILVYEYAGDRFPKEYPNEEYVKWLEEYVLQLNRKLSEQGLI